MGCTSDLCHMASVLSKYQSLFLYLCRSNNCVGPLNSINRFFSGTVHVISFSINFRMNKLAILAIIAMVLFSANAFRFQSSLRSNVEAKTGDACEQAAIQCVESACESLCTEGEDRTGCYMYIYSNCPPYV
nr:Er-1 mem [Euplotes raikovi]